MCIRDRHLADQVDSFVLNTIEHAKQERTVILRDLSFPGLRTKIAGKHVLVVSRGRGYHNDLRAVLPYIYEMRPVVIAVDGAADTLLRFGIIPHIIVGDMDSVSDTALKRGSEIILSLIHI